MPRTYVRKPGARSYKNYDEEKLLKAIQDCRHEDVSIADIAKSYNIPFRTFWNKVKGHHTKSVGGETALSAEVEEELVNHLLVCSDYGMPLEKRDVKLIVHQHLKSSGQTVSIFKDNTPGDDWVNSFIKRHEVLSNRMCQNIKRARAGVNPDEVKKYFDNLNTSLEGVPVGNILNYDETNLADEPGMKKCIFRRGVKYPERVMNFSKGNISVMFVGTAEGEMLPPYVVYKATNLWESWCNGGPKGTRFSWTKSGWMDGENFEEWFMTVVVPWARRRESPKVIIGDNLSSHLSGSVIDKCGDYNIRFILLPPNSTDKCQPLDVSFFGPMKREWRKILEEHKMFHPALTSLDKLVFPRLLSKLIERMGMKVPQNLISGFRACGIVPLNAEAVLKKYPAAAQGENERRVAKVSEAVLEYLQKYSPGGKQTPRVSHKKLQIEPGKFVTAADLQIASRPSSSGATASSSTGTTDAPANATSLRASPAGEPASASESGDSDENISDDSDEEWQPPRKAPRNVFSDFYDQ